MADANADVGVPDPHENVRRHLLKSRIVIFDLVSERCQPHIAELLSMTITKEGMGDRKIILCSGFNRSQAIETSLDSMLSIKHNFLVKKINRLLESGWEVKSIDDRLYDQARQWQT